MRFDLTSKQRTELNRAVTYFDLSRDGMLLAFVEIEGSGPVLKVQPADGAPARVVKRFQREDSILSVAFAPDGQSVFFGNFRNWPGELFRIPLVGPANPIGLGISVSAIPDISVHPDGQRLAFIDTRWTVDFWQMNGLLEAFASATRKPAPPAGPTDRSRRDH